MTTNEEAAERWIAEHYAGVPKCPKCGEYAGQEQRYWGHPLLVGPHLKPSYRSQKWWQCQDPDCATWVEKVRS